MLRNLDANHWNNFGGYLPCGDHLPHKLNEGIRQALCQVPDLQMNIYDILRKLLPLLNFSFLVSKAGMAVLLLRAILKITVQEPIQNVQTQYLTHSKYSTKISSSLLLLIINETKIPPQKTFTSTDERGLRGWLPVVTSEMSGWNQNSHSSVTVGSLHELSLTVSITTFHGKHLIFL